MKQIYNIDYSRLIQLLVPITLRKPVMLALLRAMVSPVNQLHGKFILFAQARIYDLGINGQVCYLEKMLNDRFDSTDRRIYISNSNTFQRLYIYTRDENLPLYFFTRAENKPIYVHRRDDFVDSGVDFYIILNGVSLTEAELMEMRVKVDAKRLVTKKYTIR